MSSIAQIPPEKKARVHSPPRKVVFSSALNGDAEASRKSHDKLQAKRIKAKVRDRQRKIAKTGEEPIFFDICDLLGKDKVAKTLSQGPLAEWEDKFAKGLQLEIKIQTLSAHGEGLGIAPSQDWVISVPNCLPGETVLARIYTNERLYSKADLIRVIQGAAEGSQSVQRHDELVKCRYFGKCSGCQYQFLKYDDQLEHKRNVVRRAFQNYAEGLNSSDIPAVLPTLPSPQHYKYRTKLTPHFELPREIRQRRKNKEEKMDSPLPPVSIGFDKLDEKTILDIEECVIATETINRALPGERSRIQSSIDTYKNGATILLRDSLKSFHDEESDVITDHKASVRERVGQTKFTSPAGAFFQNNRSILPALVEYVQEQIEMFALHPSRGKDSFLVDAYCGSGLFSLCLAHLFTRVAGVEISQDSIRFAKENAALNEVDNVEFLAGDAMEIFKVSVVCICILLSNDLSYSTSLFQASRQLSSLIPLDADAMKTLYSNFSLSDPN